MTDAGDSGQVFVVCVAVDENIDGQPRLIHPASNPRTNLCHLILQPKCHTLFNPVSSLPARSGRSKSPGGILNNSDKSTKSRTMHRLTASQTAINSGPHKPTTKQQPTHIRDDQQGRDVVTKVVYGAITVEETTVEMLAGYSLAAIAVWEIMSRLFLGTAASLANKARGLKRYPSLTTPDTASSPESMAA